jgi:hypothetical protein
MKLSISGGGEPIGRDPVLLDQQLYQARCACCRKLPVRGELRRVDRNIVGVAFDPNGTRMCLEDFGNSRDSRFGAGFDCRRAAIEETHLTQADDQAVASHMQSDLIPLDLGGESACQLTTDGVEVFLLLLASKFVLTRCGPARKVLPGVYRGGQ